MRRRDFMSACGLGAAACTGSAALGDFKVPGRHYIELRLYHLLPGKDRAAFTRFVGDALVPALNRLGIEPVGVFNVMFGPNKPSLYVLLPHPSLESVATLPARLLADRQFCQDGAHVLDTPMSEPAFVRFESTLMAAFDHMPRVQVPPQKKEGKPRIFELRTYESHALRPALKKIEMFNEGGEIAIFLKTGFHPVFYGQTLIGTKLPNLTYMLAFNDLVDRDASWQRFVKDPAWIELRGRKEYADTVSNITDLFLKPVGCSQI